MKFLPAFRYFLHNWQLQMQIFWNWIHVFRNSTKPLNLFRTQGSTFITRVLNKSQSFKPLHSSWKLIHWKNIWNKGIVLPIWAVQNLKCSLVGKVKFETLITVDVESWVGKNEFLSFHMWFSQILFVFVYLFWN